MSPHDAAHLESLGGAALILFWGEDLPIASISLTHYSMVTNPTLPTVPLFTLAGYFLAEGGASKRLIRVFQALLGSMRGGPAIVPAPKAEPAPSAGGTSGVQIGAFSTPGLADREFAAIVGRYPRFTGGADKRVQEVTASNGATVYRTTVTGLSREQATGLCNAIKAAGDDCFVR